MNFEFDEDIILENDVLLLKPILIDDIENLFAIATADQTLLQFSPKQVYTKELLTEYIETAIKLRANHSRYSFTIFNKHENCYMGSTSFLNIFNTDDRLEIGATWIGKQFQGTGLNRQCKFLMLQYAFDAVNAYRVEFKTDERNLQSRKAIEKIGAKFEGVLRKHTIMYDGYRRNTFCYSILKPEWELMKPLFLHAQ
ncbi:MAG: GNAT family N-acetyltransferase [Bacteroidetes bacterium]|nr:GNAT family N-acetyltransferase [Bacteroidota bacterium]MBS1649847.1 GNAT family N-acetyltransferase [Bacteroidota bacterium]